MDFKLLEQIEISDGRETRSVSLYEGDLTAIPAEHRANLLIVSAYPGNYRHIPGTLIAALAGAGLVVGDLAADKLHDLRPTTGFWLSQPLGEAGQALNIDQVACFEPELLGSAPEAVGALFRGLFPFLSDARSKSVAMPLLAAGHQGWPATDMLLALLDAACHWMQRGLAIADLKIVLLPSPQVETLAAAMKGFKAGRASNLAEVKPTSGYDVFLSYCNRDASAAAAIGAALRDSPGTQSVFDYRMEIDQGASWQRELDKAISSSRSIVALLSPDYFQSAECIEELMQARLRHKKAGGNVLVPIYWRDIGEELDLWLQVINYLDCREADEVKLASSVRSMRMLQGARS